MTPQELANIHQRGIAVPGKIYINSTGDQYIGTNKGRLEILKKAVNTPIILNTLGAISNSDTQTAINNLQNQINNLISSNNTGGISDTYTNMFLLMGA